MVCNMTHTYISPIWNRRQQFLQQGLCHNEVAAVTFLNSCDLYMEDTTWTEDILCYLYISWKLYIFLWYQAS